MANGTPLRRVHEDGRAKLLAGIDEVAITVGSTLGAAGKTVVLEEPHTGLPKPTKDGVTVADYINPIEPVANLGASLVREAAKKTAAIAGDGTTTSTVLTKAILDIASPLAKPHNFRDIIEGIKVGKDKVVKELEGLSEEVTEGNLKDIATISANNDSVIGKLIAEAYELVGLEGSVLVGESESTMTHIDINDGSTIGKGYVSPHFANSEDGSKCILDKPYVLIVDQTIDNIWKIEKVLEGALESRNSLLIIGHLEPQAIATLAVNAKKGLKICVIEAPLHGTQRYQVLEDLGKLTGANVIGEEYGTSLDIVSFQDLGTIERVEIGEYESVFKFDEPNDVVKALVKELQDSVLTAEGVEKGLLKYRLNILTGKLATIRVGAVTEAALKELKDRVDDSVHATKCALQEGVLPGGGVALKDISNKLYEGCTDEGELALYDALIAPLSIILKNGGYSFKDYPNISTPNLGVNVLTGKEVMVKAEGIIDPTKVTKHAVINAVDVAATVLSTDYIVTNVRQDELKELTQ